MFTVCGLRVSINFKKSNVLNLCRNNIVYNVLVLKLFTSLFTHYFGAILNR